MGWVRSPGNLATRRVPADRLGKLYKDAKRKSRKVAIVNPAPGGSRYTSLRKAEEYRDRGRAVFTDDGAAIRILDTAEAQSVRQARKDISSEETYWSSVAWERLKVASERMMFMMKRCATPPTIPGGPEGVAVTGFIPYIPYIHGPKKKKTN